MSSLSPSSARGALDVPVLVVGAGPAGLTAAITLARHGVEVLLAERRAEGPTLPRSTVVSTRSMELMRAWGVAAEIEAAAVEVEWAMWHAETLADVASGVALPVGLPTRAQSAVVSPSHPACAPQDQVEPVLVAHLRSLDAARVRFRTELVALEQDADGVRALLRDVATGGLETVRARHLVAADGAHSSVRATLGVAMDGPAELMSGATAVFRAPIWDLLGPHRYGVYSVEAGGVFLPAGRGDRWVFGSSEAPGEEPADLLDPAATVRRIRRGAGRADLEVRLERLGPARAGAQIARRFRHGRILLVGDAAHRVTPRGGTGMNTAIGDGHDVGWKLAWLEVGWAGDDLLDTYEPERRPVAEHNLARSKAPDGTVRAAEQEMPVDLGGRIPHVWLPGEHGRISSLDLLGPGLTLFTAPGGATDAPVGGRPPLSVRPLDAITARALGIGPGGALLARPDGAPVATWSRAPGAGEVRRAWPAPREDAAAEEMPAAA
jgi:putative polyketide hydroxylase